MVRFLCVGFAALAACSSAEPNADSRFPADSSATSSNDSAEENDDTVATDTADIDTAAAPDTEEPDTFTEIDTNSGDTQHSPPDSIADASEDTTTQEIADSEDTSVQDAVPPIPVAPLPPVGYEPTYLEPCIGDHSIEDPLYHLCVQCVSDSHCLWGQICERGNCVGDVRTQCVYDADCAARPAGHVCLPDIMVCGECYEDWQCPTGTHCEDHVCVEGESQTVFCTSDSECPSGVCSSIGHCAECNTDDQCQDGHVCRRFRCLTPFLPWENYNGPVVPLCSADTDCAPFGVPCNSALGLCDLGPVCRTDADCGGTNNYYNSRYFCSPAGFCEPGECLANTGTRCVDPCRELGRCYYPGESSIPGYLPPMIYSMILRCGPNGRWLPPEDECGRCTATSIGIHAQGGSCCPKSNPSCGPSACIETCNDAYTGFLTIDAVMSVHAHQTRQASAPRPPPTYQTSRLLPNLR